MKSNNTWTKQEILSKYHRLAKKFDCMLDELKIISANVGAGSVTFDTAYELLIPAGKFLDRIVVEVAGDQTINIGDTNGSSEYFGGTVLASDPLILDIDLYSALGQTIWITGGTGITVKYYIV